MKRKRIEIVFIVLILLTYFSSLSAYGLTTKDNESQEFNPSFNDPKLERLDQQQAFNFGLGFYYYGNEHAWGQSFTPTVSKIDSIQVFLRKFNDPKGSIVISIQDSLYNLYPSNKYITPSTSHVSISIDIDDIILDPIDGGWINVNLPHDLNVNQGSTYYIVITPQYTFTDSHNWLAWLGSEHNLYPRGCAWWCYFGEWTDEAPHGSVQNFDYCFKIYGMENVANIKPNKPSMPIGPTNGRIKEEYTYSTITTDPDGGKVKYGWDWDGDGLVDAYGNLGQGWMEDWYKSNEQIYFTYENGWQRPGIYDIRVMAIDEHGLESVWSDPLTVYIFSLDTK